MGRRARGGAAWTEERGTSGEGRRHSAAGREGGRGGERGAERGAEPWRRAGTPHEQLEFLEHAAELARRGEAFALATVVWRQPPSSGKEGCRAIITGSGEVHGWIGGACAEPVVIREARRVIAEGTPRLLLIGPPEQFGGSVPEGMTFMPISCQNEGALEVYIEPAAPASHDHDHGHRPAREAGPRPGKGAPMMTRPDPAALVMTMCQPKPG